MIKNDSGLKDRTRICWYYQVSPVSRHDTHSLSKNRFRLHLTFSDNGTNLPYNQPIISSNKPSSYISQNMISKLRTRYANLSLTKNVATQQGQLSV